MKRFTSRRPSPALLIACMSLFVALGGVSYGVATGSIDSREVKNNSLRGEDLRRSTITEREIRGRSLDGTDIKLNRVGGNAIKEESVGKIPASSVRWVLVNANGDIEEQSGGFTVASKPLVNGQPDTNPNIYINAGSSLVGKGLSATTALANTPAAAFNGDVSVGRCATAAINCVPANTNVANVLVVRSLANNSEVASAPRRFYVEVTE